MPLYWKNPPRANGKAHRTQTHPISAVALAWPKYTPTATTTASSAKMSWRSDNPKKQALLIVSDLFVDAYLDWISPPFPFLDFWQTGVAMSAGVC